MTDKDKIINNIFSFLGTPIAPTKITKSTKTKENKILDETMCMAIIKQVIQKKEDQVKKDDLDSNTVNVEMKNLQFDEK
jgi:hypothetical protein